jgi:hypothetical protein
VRTYSGYECTYRTHANAQTFNVYMCAHILHMHVGTYCTHAYDTCILLRESLLFLLQRELFCKNTCTKKSVYAYLCISKCVCTRVINRLHLDTCAYLGLMHMPRMRAFLYRCARSCKMCAHTMHRHVCSRMHVKIRAGIQVRSICMLVQQIVFCMFQLPRACAAKLRAHFHQVKVISCQIACVSRGIS